MRDRGDDSKETGFFRHTRCTQELTETGQHARDLRRFKADTVLAERRESHALTKKGLQLRDARRRKAVFCSGVTLGVSPPLRVGCMLVSSRPTQNTLYAFLSFLFLHVCILFCVAFLFAFIFKSKKDYKVGDVDGRS